MGIVDIWFERWFVKKTKNENNFPLDSKVLANFVTTIIGLAIYELACMIPPLNLKTIDIVFIDRIITDMSNIKLFTIFNHNFSLLNIIAVILCASANFYVIYNLWLYKLRD